MEDEEPDDAADRGCDAVGPEEQRTVDRQAADLRVGERGEQQGQRQPGERHHEREHEAGERAPEVGGVAEEPLEVGEAGPDEPVTEGRGAVEGEPERVEGGPEEEGERDGDLRRHESVGQPPVPEDETLHRGWPSRPSLVERGELLKDLARLRDRVVQPLLRRLLAAEDVLHLLLDGVADGGEVAKANALTVRRGLAAEHRSEEHTSELQSQSNLVCRLLLEKKNTKAYNDE